MRISLKTDFSIMDRGLKNLDFIVNKTMGESAESITNRIHYNWSASSPSSPGQPPAVVSGALDDSIQADTTGRNSAGQFASGKDIIAWYIRVNADYGAALEYGYAARNLDARPYILPAVLAEQDEVGSKFQLNFGGLWK